MYSREGSPSQIQKQVYGEMVTFEELVISENGQFDFCRNGLKLNQHKKDFTNMFNEGQYDFE